MKKTFRWHKNYIFWQIVALIVVKAVFSYSGLQFADLLSGVSPFSKTEVISETNAFRSLFGLTALNENPVLDQAASQKLQDMIRGGYFAHYSPAGVSPWHWIEANNYKYIYAGENLAIGFYTAKDTVNAWANSPTHRQNLLNSHYQEIGIAVAPAKLANEEGILVVQLFGTPMPNRAPIIAKNAARSTAAPTPKPSVKPSPIIPIKAVENSIVQAPETNPVVIATHPRPQVYEISQILNSALALYSLLAFVITIMAVVFIEARRGLVVQTALNFAIVILVLVIPTLHLSSKAFIL